MGKSVKSVKKFSKKHLGATIARRHKLKPMNNALRKKRDAQLSAGYAEDQAAAKADAAKLENKAARKPKRVQDMSVDELMQGDFLENTSDEDEDKDDPSEDDGLSNKDDDDEDSLEIASADLDADMSDEDEEDEDEDGTGLGSQNKALKSEVSKHKQQLERLQQKDPEFYQFLKEHDKELLDFDDEDGEGSERDEGEEEKEGGAGEERGEDEASVSLSTSLVEAWCTAVKEKQHVGALKSLLRAFRTACHYGDGEMEDVGSKFNITNSHVFNKIMLFVLVEIDAVFKKMLGLADMNEKKSGSVEVQKLSKWKKLEPLVKTYLGNALHILNQMTDNQMIAFTVRRLKASVIFLAAFPILARKYMKVALHFWGSGEGALPLLSFMFVREMALRLGSNYLEACLKGIYKEYVANSRFVNPTSAPRIQFMSSCVVELYGIDTSASYQNAFIFIRQLAIVLRNALTMKTKDSFKQVYRWQYVNSLNVWVRVLSAYSEQLRPLVYPLSQVIDGVSHLVPTARYFPLRLHCVQMLNRLAAATNAFIPVASLLLDMLQFKDLHMNPTGGVGKALDFSTIVKVSKPVLKTRTFQEDCVSGAVEQLTEHLAQNSYSVAFPELAVVPLVQLRRLIKGITVDRFRKQFKQLVEQIEKNVEYVGKKRDGVSFSPKDISAAASFLEEEKKAGASPLSQFAASLQQRAAQRQTALHTTSVVVGSVKDHVDSDDDDEDEEMVVEEGAKAFGNDWLPPKKTAEEKAAEKTARKPAKKGQVDTSAARSNEDDDDVLEDLELSSSDEDDDEASFDVSEDEDDSGADSDDDDDAEQHATPKKRQKMSVREHSEPNSNGKPAKEEFSASKRGAFGFGGSSSRVGSPGGSRGGRGSLEGGRGGFRGGRRGSSEGSRGGFRGQSGGRSPGGDRGRFGGRSGGRSPGGDRGRFGGRSGGRSPGGGRGGFRGRSPGGGRGGFSGRSPGGRGGRGGRGRGSD